MKYNREITLSLKLNNTGMRAINGQTISSTIQFTQQQSEALTEGVKFGSFKREPLTFFEWLIATFKEELSEEINNLLLDELKGHNHSIPRHSAFETWLEGQEVKLSAVKKLD